MAKVPPLQKWNARAFEIFGGFQDHPRDKQQLGVELEYEVSENFEQEDVAKEVNEIVGDFALIKRDGTLENGFELNSTAASLTFHRRAWDGFFGNKVRKKLRVSEGMCGMHVHVNREGVTNETVRNLETFIYSKRNRDFIVDIAGRVPPEDYADLDRKTHRGPRYYALNTTGERAATIEFRLFKSTYSKTIFFMRLEFVKAAIRFCSESKEFDYKSFINFVRNESKSYSYLFKYLERSEKWKHIKSPSIETMNRRLASRGLV